MITRVRVEAEGSSPQEVEDQLSTAMEVIVNESSRTQRAIMFGLDGDKDFHPALAEGQAGEFVIERFARDTGGEAGHGAIVYKGRMVSHFARPQKLQKLNRHHDDTVFHVD